MTRTLNVHHAPGSRSPSPHSPTLDSAEATRVAPHASPPEQAEPGAPAESMPHQPRRAPVQERSRARVEAILDAAEQVFLELGYPNATTNHVAARAGTSIGSLYRFFPDKEALLLAIAARYDDRMRQMATALSPAAPEEVAALTLEQLIGRGVDAFGAFLKDSPGFRTLIQEQRNPVLQVGAQQHLQQMGEILGAAHRALAPQLPREEQGRITFMTQTVLGLVHELALSVDESQRLLMLSEGKRMVSLYLADRLGVPLDVPLGEWMRMRERQS